MDHLIYLIVGLRLKVKGVISKMNHKNTIRVRVEIGFNRINFLKFAKILEFKNGKICTPFKTLKTCLKITLYKLILTKN